MHSVTLWGVGKLADALRSLVASKSMTSPKPGASGGITLVKIDINVARK